MTPRTAFRHCAAAVASATAVAAVGVVAAAPTVQDGGPQAGPVTAFTPPTFGLDTDPDALLPTGISATRPVTVVSTVLDATGRPVVTRHRAVDRTAARTLVREAQQAPGAVGVELDVPVRVEAITGGDPYRGQQWDIATLGAAASWELSTGAGVTVAVLDTGVDAGHPDLAGHVLPGIDLVTDTEGVSIDPHGHGTHVAGTIAAVTGNGIGVSGFAPDAAILPVRVLAADGSGVMSDVATGLVLAADRGADVVNMSLGALGQAGSVTTAIGYARSKGVVVVAAAGNSRGAGSPTNWPAADAGVIGVAATQPSDVYADFSNRGPYVDVAAPGQSILSTAIESKGGSYLEYSGTSMAAPHVAALAAQLKAVNPQLSPDEVQQAMQGTAVDLGDAGRDDDYGHGRIRPWEALQAVMPTPSAPPATTAPATTAPPTTAPATVAPTTAAPTTGAPSSPPATAPATTAPTTASPTPTATPTTAPAPPTAAPTSAPPVVRPSITSSATSRVVAYGTVVTSVFTVTAQGLPWAGRPVSICRSVAGGAWSCTPGTTTAQGTVRHVRAATATYRLRVQVTATASSSAVSSPTITYTSRAGADLVRSGSRALRAHVDGAVGQTVSVQRRQGTRWVTVTTYRAVSSRTITGLRTGYRYRIVVAGTASVTGAQSGTVAL